MALPSSGPISLRQIGDYLGAYDLLAYRGRTYYRGGTPVVISQNPSLQEFYGLSNVPPLNQDCYTFWLDAPNQNPFIQIRWWPQQGSGGVHAANGVNLYSLTYGPAYNPALYKDFSYSYRINSGCCLTDFQILDADAYNVLHHYAFAQGSNINVTMHVTANPA